VNRPGQVAGVLPVKRPRQAAPTVLFGIVCSSWWFFLSAGAVLPILPAFISRHLGDGSLGIGWAYFLYSAASIAIRPWAGRYPARGRARPMIAAGLLLFGCSVAAIAASTSALFMERSGCSPAPPKGRCTRGC
jgi:MFS family permease